MVKQVRTNSSRSELACAIQKKDACAVVDIISSMTSQGIHVAEVIAECSLRCLDDMWEDLHCACVEILTSEETDGQLCRDTDQLGFLDVVVSLANATIQRMDKTVPVGLVDTVVVLHGVLLTLSDAADKVLHRLAQLLAEWWLRRLPDWTEIATNTFLYFLRRSVAKETMADMKIVCRMQSVVSLILMDSPSGVELKQLLERGCSSACFVKTPQGQLFLASVMTSSCDNVSWMHGTIKKILPLAPRASVPFYGKIYFKAWQRSSGDVLQALENDCIQNLINHAIHADRRSAQCLSSILFRLLNYFHSQKKEKGVDSMLLKLYNPILWRSLTVPNSDVRANTVELFLDAFPFSDPALSAMDADALIQKQFDFMHRLLVDPCASVRVVAVTGVCHVLTSYVQMIPDGIVQALLQKLFKGLAWDVVSVDVRVSVIKGITRLLSNPFLHLTLKPLLPGLGPCLHDTSHRVLISVLNLLLKVKLTPTLKYWNVTPVEDLLARLESGAKPAVHRIMKLIYPSFFMLHKGDEKLVERTVTLLETNRGATRIYFLHLPHYLLISDTVQYVTLLCKYILENIRSMSQSSDNYESDGLRGTGRLSKISRRNENQDAGVDNGDATDSEGSDDGGGDDGFSVWLLEGLLEAILLMTVTVSDRLNASCNHDLKQSLMKKLSIVVAEVWKVSDDPSLTAIVMKMAGFLLPKVVPTIRMGCLSKLRHLPDHSDQAEFVALLETMCLWEMAPDVLQMISDWLADIIVLKKPVEKSQKTLASGRTKSVRIAVSNQQARRPRKALDYLSAILKSHVCLCQLKKKHVSQLSQLDEILSQVTVLVESLLSGELRLTADNVNIAVDTLSIHLRLGVLLGDMPSLTNDSLKCMVRILGWAQRTLVPFASESGERGDTCPQASSLRCKLVHDCLSTVFLLCRNMFLLGICCEDFIKLFLDFCCSVLFPQQPVPPRLTHMCRVLKCLHQLLLSDQPGDHRPVYDVLSRSLDVFSARVRSWKQGGDDDDDQLLAEVKLTVVQFIVSVMKHHRWKDGGRGGGGRSVPMRSSDMFVVTMVKSALDELSRYSVEDKLNNKNMLPAWNTDGLPTMSMCVMKGFTVNVVSRRLLFQEIGRTVCSNECRDVHRLHGVVHFACYLLSKGSYCKDFDWLPLSGSLNEVLVQLSAERKFASDSSENVFRSTMESINDKMEIITQKLVT